MKPNDIFCNEVNRVILNHELILPEEKVLVAISGGADSVALLMVLHQLNYRCEAVHCNFHLRGEESNRDEKFVRDFCRSLSIRLHVRDFDTISYAKQKGVSIEMAARELRYDYFEHLRTDLRFDKIAVAHHRNDNVETLLLNLVRGTGLKGLTGMKYRNGFVVRPFLDFSRERIEFYLERQEQGFMTDSTNLETDTIRNKIRLEILPILKEINPNITQTLQETTVRLQDACILYNMTVDRLKAELNQHNHISIEALRQFPAMKTVLFEILSDYGFNREQTSDIYRLLNGPSGRTYESEEWRLLRDRAHLILQKKSEREECLCRVLPLEGIVKVTQRVTLSIQRRAYDSHFEIPRSKDTVCLDLDKLEYPITIRFIESGDRFVPLGMKGSKLVSDYLTDTKKTLFEKESQLAVWSGERLAWLVDERCDERFKVDANTSRVLVIKCLKKES